jgi:hypothetical protein
MQATGWDGEHPKGMKGMIALPRWFPVALLAAAMLALLLLLWWVFWGQPYGVADAFGVWATVMAIVFILGIGALKPGASQ